MSSRIEGQKNQNASLPKINPVDRYGSETQEQVAGRITTDLREWGFIRDFTDNIVFDCTLKAFQKYGNPTIYHIIQELALDPGNPKDRSYQATQTALNRLKRITSESSTYKCSKGFPPELYSEMTIIIDLRGKPVYTAIQLINNILWILMRSRRPTETLKTVVLLEEAQIFVSRVREARFDLGEILIYSCMRQGRHLGLSFILVSQTVATFGPAVLANVNNVVTGRLLSGSDVHAMTTRLGLTERQVEALQALRERNFIVQTAASPEPSLLEVPFIERPKYDERELKALTQEHLSRIPFTPFPQELQDFGKGVWKGERPPERDFRKALVRDLLENPFDPQIIRCQRFGKSQEEMAKTMKGLEQNGIIQRQSFGLGRGKPKEGALLTKAGLNWIGAKENVPGRGSLQARYIIYRLAHEVFERCYVEAEGCDLEVYDDGKMAVELELEGGKGEHFLANIRRNISSGFDWVMVLGMTEKAVMRMQKIAKERLSLDVLQKVEFKLVSQVLHGS